MYFRFPDLRFPIFLTTNLSVVPTERTYIVVPSHLELSIVPATAGLFLARPLRTLNSYFH